MGAGGPLDLGGVKARGEQVLAQVGSGGGGRGQGWAGGGGGHGDGEV
jgi:hypothetical protein